MRFFEGKGIEALSSGGGVNWLWVVVRVKTALAGAERPGSNTMVEVDKVREGLGSLAQIVRMLSLLAVRESVLDETR